MPPAHQTVLILDFGSQYTQLIARRVREQKVYCAIAGPGLRASEVRAAHPAGIILSGGPDSVYRAGAPQIDPEILTLSKCEKCGTNLHSCIQCVNFDPSARFECSETIPARISPKDAANTCELYTARTSFERETSSTPAPAAASSSSSSSPESASSAKKAFDDLFKF